MGDEIIMKRLIVFLVAMMLLVACSSDNNNENNNDNNNNNNESENENVNLNENNTEENDVNQEKDNHNENNQNEDNNLVNNDEDNQEEVADLQLQLTKVDEESGVTIENSEVYQRLDEYIKENPKQGAANDFSAYIYTTVISDDGQINLILMAINRLDQPIKNVSFDFTLGKTDEDGEELVFENLPVALPEEEFGSFQPDHMMPFLIEMSEEQAELVQEIDTTNQIFEINAFDLEQGE